MSLASPALTTTSYKKRKVKITKAMQQELERGWRERNVRLKQMGLPKETLEQYTDWVHGRSKKEKTKTVSNTKGSATDSESRQGKKILSVDSWNQNNSTDSSRADSKTNGKVETTTRGKVWITGPVSSKPSPTYTGTEMIGIAVLHKSCLQPIFNKEAAEDAAKMRR